MLGGDGTELAGGVFPVSFVQKAQSRTDGRSDIQQALRKMREEENLTGWSVPSGSS